MTFVRFASFMALFICFNSCHTLADSPESIEFFESKIRPVLVEHCYKCHSEAAQKAGKLRGGLHLDSKAGWQKGGDTGTAIVAGQPAEGTLLQSLRYNGDLQMPPKGKLPDNVIADFEKWIKAGAADPRTTKAVEGTPAGVDLDKGREFWSFQQPKAPPLPKISKPVLPIATAIDAFIQAKWNEQGLTPASLADKRTLIRRVSFDLTGLPPRAEDVDAFLADQSANAWAKVIDRLLASPQYGERWARHWLDVARYAEDQAHTFAVTPKRNAYLYRDWVVRAFNEDWRYDQFVRLQIAGDLLPDSDGDLFKKLAGLGFMGLGAEYYKNTAREQAIAEELDDRVDTLTRGFLGLTVACARCHDHKFDPIPTRDYYSLAGIYNGTSMSNAPLVGKAELDAYNTAQERVKSAEVMVNKYLTGIGRAAAKKAVNQTNKYLLAVWELRAKKPKVNEIAKRDGLERYFLDRWIKYLDAGNASKTPELFKPWFSLKAEANRAEVEKVAAAIEAELREVDLPESLPAKGGKKKNNKNADALTKALFLNQNAPLLVSVADAEKLFLSEAAKPKLMALRGEVDKLKQASPPAPLMAHVIAGGGQEMKIYIRGNPATKGDPAPKGFLQVLPTTKLDQKSDFTRLDLANAIASSQNPLTARVIVNRVWAWHFGRGLVATPSNFGKLGEQPSHPELLDYLAVEFIKNGWSLKWLHRQILTSSVYQLGTGTLTEANKKDSANVYLWQSTRKRLDVEAWRDSLLAVSGRLDATLGGPSFDLKDPNATRRTVYAKISRHELDGLLRMFDFPDANVTADKRTTTTVPQQQLFALNSEFMLNQAKSFAERCQKLGDNDQDRIRAAYRLAFQRNPSPRELDLAMSFLKLPLQSQDKLSRWQQYAQALLASNEFLHVD